MRNHQRLFGENKVRLCKYISGEYNDCLENNTPTSNSNSSSNTTTPTDNSSSGSNTTTTVDNSNTSSNAGSVSTSGTVYWTPNGKSYHTTKGCSTLSRSKTILEGTLQESGKSDPCDRCH